MNIQGCRNGIGHCAIGNGIAMPMGLQLVRIIFAIAIPLQWSTGS
jgi:hypothetical protein